MLSSLWTDNAAYTLPSTTDNIFYSDIFSSKSKYSTIQDVFDRQSASSDTHLTTTKPSVKNVPRLRPTIK